jgi:hypothetical protein
VAATYWKPGEHEIAVTARSNWHIGLKNRMQLEGLPEQPGLIVIVAPFDKPIDFLKADKVWLFVIDAIDHPLERIPTISATNALVNIPRKQPHRASCCLSHEPCLTGVDTIIGIHHA